MRSVWCLVVLASSLSSTQGMAQDLTLTNARIIDGTGRVIERGSIVIASGRVVSVTQGDIGPGAIAPIDVAGMTVLPGLIDTHRHDLLGDLQALTTLKSDADVAAAIDSVTPVKLQAILREGFTTVMMPGTYLSASQRVRRQLAEGQILGPRLLYSGPGFTAPGDFPVEGMVCQGNAYCASRVAFQVTNQDSARTHVRSLAAAGVDAIKIFVDGQGAELNNSVLAAIADAASESELPVLLHAHSVGDMLNGVKHGVTRLVHTPGDLLIDADGARTLRERGVAIATTVSMSSSKFAEALGFEYTGAPRHQRILTNIRYLFDQAVTVAFGTDSPDRLNAQTEIEELSAVLNSDEIIAALTRNAAIFLGLDKQIGTLEPGMIGDIVVIDGDPLKDISNLRRVALVIQGGKIVVDTRQ